MFFKYLDSEGGGLVTHWGTSPTGGGEDGRKRTLIL